MNRTRRQELFWLFVIAGCIVLFVMHRQNNSPRKDASDRSGMAELFAGNSDDSPTGTITPKPRPVMTAHTGAYYVPLGSYNSVDFATKRYLSVARAAPRLERSDKIAIETVKVSDGTRHRVRMGNFASIQQARKACSDAAINLADCPVVEAH